MSAHGTVSLWMADHAFQYRADKAAKVKLRSGPLILAGSDSGTSGFKHFLRPPAPEEQFAIDGLRFDPTDSGQRTRANSLMAKLATTMLLGSPTDFVNTDIPSGYTYFLQLIAHDVVESSLFLSRNQSSLLGLGNIRTKPLRLETIFGGGPIDCPHAYDVNDCGFRDRLRLGQVRADGSEGYSVNTGDFRDIPRARATDMLARPSYPEALIGDSRNDSHAILSQLVVMLHHLQRKVLANIEANENLDSTGSAIVDAQRNFVATQSACALVFRNIVRHDVLRKILHPDVRAAYETNAVQIADTPTGLNDGGPWSVPVEFSFGFYRFGHSMIRPVYSFNSKNLAPNRPFNVTEVLQHTSEQNPLMMPVEDKWTIDWRFFFGNDPSTSNFSVKIGPWSRMDIEHAVRGPDEHEPGLTVRDLTSSIATQPWSVRALAQALTATHGHLFQSSPYLKGNLNDPNDPPWLGDIRNWLEQRRTWPGGGLFDNDIDTLAADPPIPFFARFEAGMDPAIGGKHLGVLTSIVVADVLYGVFRDDRILGVDGSLDLASQLQEVSKLAFDGALDAFTGLGGIATANDLIVFLDTLIQSPAGGSPV
jgi:hypothetical protein